MATRRTIWKFEDLSFDGLRDKLLVPENPLAGASAFTIEVLFMPEGSGEEEQRFLHVQGEDGSRALLELRVTPKGWYGDVFLHFESGEKFLNDPQLLHPFAKWSSMALVYDCRKLRQFVNGKLELEDQAPCGVLGAGNTSIGIRMNNVSPFKGRIAEIRFTPHALTSQFLVP